MPSELVSASVVVAANQFNPTVFSQPWLVRNKFLSERDLQAGLFAPMAANVQTERFVLFVAPPQLQFVPTVAKEEQGSLILAIVGGIIRAIPHTPFSGAGLNFTWHLSYEREIAAIGRHYFAVPGSPLFAAFDTPDAKYGTFVSKDTLGCRLQLDIRPIKLNDREVMQCASTFTSTWHRPKRLNRICGLCGT